MYCNTLVCIAVKRVETVSQYSSLYCDSRGSGLLDCVATQGGDTASQATTRCRGMRSRGAAGAWGARHVHWACGLGVVLANRLCTWCTQPNFDPI